MNVLFLILIGTLTVSAGLQSENSGYEQVANDVPPSPVSSDGADQQAYNSEGQVANDSPRGLKKIFKVKFQPDIDFSQFPGFSLPDTNGIAQQVFNFNTRVEVQGDAPQKPKPTPVGDGYGVKKT